jgi:hypothetical protein
MSKRISAAAFAAALTMAVAGIAMSSTAEAARGDGGGGTSRSCLTGAAQSLLNSIESRFGPVRIVSTCRPGATIAGSGKPSRHASGNAIDFEAGGRKGEIVRWLAANHSGGGTMTYGDSSHIHVDVGSRFVSLAAGTRSYGGGRARSNDNDGNDSSDRPSRRRSRSDQVASADTGSSSGRRGRETLAGYMGLGGQSMLNSK